MNSEEPFESLAGGGFLKIERTSPREFAEATRKLRDEHDITPAVDPNSPIQVSNLFPRMTVEEVAEDMGVEYDTRDHLTPDKMRREIDLFRQELTVLYEMPDDNWYARIIQAAIESEEE